MYRPGIHHVMTVYFWAKMLCSSEGNGLKTHLYMYVPDQYSKYSLK